MNKVLRYEERYKVKNNKINEYNELLLEFKEMLKEIDIPHLIDWYVEQDKYIPGDIRNVWILEEQADVDKMWDITFSNEKWSSLVARIFETMVDGSYTYGFWTKIISLE